MKIEAKMSIRDKPDPQGDFYHLEEGDQITVPDEIGAYWVKNGWVKNLDTGEDNEPLTSPVTLDIHAGKTEVSDSN